MDLEGLFLGVGPGGVWGFWGFFEGNFYWGWVVVGGGWVAGFGAWG